MRGSARDAVWTRDDAQVGDGELGMATIRDDKNSAQRAAASDDD